MTYQLLSGLCWWKFHKDSFQLATRGKRAREPPLELIHSDVCGKFQTPSLRGGYYFLTFIDDSTGYGWVHILNDMTQVFGSLYVEWIALLENLHKCKNTLHMVNGGVYI